MNRNLEQVPALKTLADVRVLRKTSAQTVNNSTSYVDVTQLALPVLANEGWEIDAFVIIDSSAAADAKLTFTGPAGMTMSHSIVLYKNTAASWLVAEGDPGGGGHLVGGEGAGTPRLVYLAHCLILIGATAGTIQLRFAQNAAEVSDTKVRENSVMICRRIT